MAINPEYAKATYALKDEMNDRLFANEQARKAARFEQIRQAKRAGITPRDIAAADNATFDTAARTIRTEYETARDAIAIQREI